MLRSSYHTCFCIVLSERPSKEGKFEQRCSIHQRSTTLEVYAHNIANKPRDFTGTGKQREPTSADTKRVRDLKESTRV